MKKESVSIISWDSSLVNGYVPRDLDSDFFSNHLLNDRCAINSRLFAAVKSFRRFFPKCFWFTFYSTNNLLSDRCVYYFIRGYLQQSKDSEEFPQVFLVLFFLE